MAEPTLWHYTCDHGHAGLGQGGLVLPGVDLGGPLRGNVWLSALSWFTDLDAPIRDGLGLTMRLARCDRTRWRYRVTDRANVRPWLPERGALLPARLADALEREPGALPRHWFVATEPVPVMLDQRGEPT